MTLNRFAQTRASYVAQISLFGYLKTRMGTQFRDYFQDDVFSAAIRDASVKIFVSCLSDLTVYVVARVLAVDPLPQKTASDMALQCFDAGMANALADIDSEKIPSDARDRFEQRLRETNWLEAGEGDKAFALSPVDSMRYAPVVDEFKKLDSKIVSNSIRFKWRDVRENFGHRIVAERVLEDWNQMSGI